MQLDLKLQPNNPNYITMTSAGLFFKLALLAEWYSNVSFMYNIARMPLWLKHLLLINTWKYEETKKPQCCIIVNNTFVVFSSQFIIVQMF